MANQQMAQLHIQYTSANMQITSKNESLEDKVTSISSDLPAYESSLENMEEKLVRDDKVKVETALTKQVLVPITVCNGKKCCPGQAG